MINIVCDKSLFSFSKVLNSLFFFLGYTSEVFRDQARVREQGAAEKEVLDIVVNKQLIKGLVQGNCTKDYVMHIAHIRNCAAFWKIKCTFCLCPPSLV